jgi:pimeloyl-ACP methyl ester carboxylesterase
MTSLFLQEQGSGQPIVFIHGFCETHEIWKEFVTPFITSYRVITLDLPGFGSSELLSTPFTIDDVGDAVAETLEHHNISDAAIIGHSLGGYVALSLAKNHSSLLKGLGLFHSSAFADSEEKKENRNKVIESVKNYGALPFIDTFVPGLFFDKSNAALKKVYAIASKTRSETIINYTVAMRDRPDSSQMWTKSDLPKLLISGREDTSIPAQISRELGEIGHNLRFIELEKTGHMGFFEAETECQLTIKSFTDELFSDK